MGDRRRVPALDGLRGLAVLLVLVGHSRLPGLSQAAGAGVVVFFVLSGYLFAHILGGEVERTGTVALRRFWARRVRRLLPALVVMVAGVALIAWAVGYPMAQYGRDAGWTLGYAANVQASGGGEGPLRHAWSLAVEEHFYLVWPLVMLVFGRRIIGSARSPRVLAGIAAALMVWRLWLLATGHVGWAYFGDEGNAAGLLAGCAAGIAQLQGRSWRVPTWVLPAGVAAGCAGWAYESRIELAVILSPVVVAAVAVSLPALPRALAWSPLRGMGRISYGAYLWHYPLVYLAVGAVYPARGIMAAVFAVGIAAASWRWIERPITSGSAGSSRTRRRPAAPTAASARR